MQLKLTLVSMGNPHAIHYIESGIDEFPLSNASARSSKTTRLPAPHELPGRPGGRPWPRDAPRLGTRIRDHACLRY